MDERPGCLAETEITPPAPEDKTPGPDNLLDRQRQDLVHSNLGRHPSGHHFFPAITTDASTGTTNVIYYSTEKDSFKHELSVVLNQIATGSTTLGAPQFLANKLDIDDDPGDQGFFLFSPFIGAVARGNGTPGQSHLYTSFDSTAVNGTYNGKSIPESNNTIMLHTF
jgi:hypothetical protein